MKTLIGLLVLTVGLAVLVACDDDPVQPPPPPLREFKFEDLSEKWHVLNNIELAYAKRRLDKYDQLLDNSFTFFLSVGDVGGGLPASWDRAIEIQSNTNLFAKDPPPPAPIPRCKSILMDIQWEDENGKPALTWVEFTPPGSTETWYMTTVFYDFQIDVEPDMTYINGPGAKAQFTVRNAGTADAPQWRLVEMRDLGNPGLVVRSSSATESITWGRVKALYRG